MYTELVQALNASHSSLDALPILEVTVCMLSQAMLGQAMLSQAMLPVTNSYRLRS